MAQYIECAERLRHLVLCLDESNLKRVRGLVLDEKLGWLWMRWLDDNYDASNRPFVPYQAIRVTPEIRPSQLLLLEDQLLSNEFRPDKGEWLDGRGQLLDVAKCISGAAPPCYEISFEVAPSPPDSPANEFAPLDTSLRIPAEGEPPCFWSENQLGERPLHTLAHLWELERNPDWGWVSHYRQVIVNPDSIHKTLERFRVRLVLYATHVKATGSRAALVRGTGSEFGQIARPSPHPRAPSANMTEIVESPPSALSGGSTMKVEAMSAASSLPISAGENSAGDQVFARSDHAPAVAVAKAACEEALSNRPDSIAPPAQEVAPATARTKPQREPIEPGTVNKRPSSGDLIRVLPSSRKNVRWGIAILFVVGATVGVLAWMLMEKSIARIRSENRTAVARITELKNEANKLTGTITKLGDETNRLHAEVLALRVNLERTNSALGDAIRREEEARHAYREIQERYNKLETLAADQSIQLSSATNEFKEATLRATPRILQELQKNTKKIEDSLDLFQNPSFWRSEKNAVRDYPQLITNTFELNKQLGINLDRLEILLREGK
jgi:hypothetical protein